MEILLRLILIGIGVVGISILPIIIRAIGWVLEDIMAVELLDLCADFICVIVLTMVCGVFVCLGVMAFIPLPH